MHTIKCRPSINRTENTYEDSYGSSNNIQREVNAEESDSAEKERQFKPQNGVIWSKAQRKDVGTDKSILENKQPVIPTFNLIRLTLLLASILGIVFYFYYLSNENEGRCFLSDLESQYPAQKFEQISIGIESILNKKTDKPAVYLFLITNSASKTLNLIKNIANRSSQCFGTDSQIMEITTEDFLNGNYDYGKVIQKYKNNIKERNVVLIANLNQIPGKTARALHAICDTHSPITKNVVIFLTLETTDLDSSPQAAAENTLKNLWQHDLVDTELDPLISRVTDEVIELRS